MGAGDGGEEAHLNHATAIWTGLVLTGLGSFAAAGPRPDEEAGEVVVVGRRSAQDPFESDRSLQVLDAAALQKSQPQSLPDALEGLPGVLVQRTNRGSGAPFLRGLVGPENLILIDGLRFNNATFRTGPNQALATLDPSAFSGAELLFGPGSALYGSDAVGGVINLRPAAFPALPGTGLAAGARFASADLSAGLWAQAHHAGERFALLAGGALREFGPLRAGGGARVPWSDYHQGAWHARARIEPGQDTRLEVTYLAARLGGVGRTDQLGRGRVTAYDNADDFLALSFRWRPGGVIGGLRLAAGLHRTLEVQNQLACALADGPGPAAQHLCLEAARAAYAPRRQDRLPEEPVFRHAWLQDEVLSPLGLGQLDLVFLDGRLLLSVGGEAAYDAVGSERFDRRGASGWTWSRAERGSFSDGSSYLHAGGFAHLEASLWEADGQALLLAGGGRVSHAAAWAPDVPGLGALAYAYTGFTGAASLRWRAGRVFLARLGYAGGFRAPNLQETTVLGDTGDKFEVPHGGLRPEVNHAIELGARLELSWLRLEADGFASLLRDLIDERALPEEEWRAMGIEPEAVGGKPVVQRVNGQRGLLWGLMASAQVGPFFGFRPFFELAYLRGDVEPAEGPGHPARRIPPLMGQAGLRWARAEGGLYAEAVVRFALGQDRLHPSDLMDVRICADPEHPGRTLAEAGRTCPGTPGWSTLDLRGGLGLAPGLWLDVALTNLLDARYRLHGSGVDAPGAELRVSLRGEI